MFGPLSSLKFLFMGPVILVFLFLVNVLSWDGEWWVQWPALGIGLAWFINLFRVIRAVVVLGGMAAVATYFANRR